VFDVFIYEDTVHYLVRSVRLWYRCTSALNINTARSRR